MEGKKNIDYDGRVSFFFTPLVSLYEVVNWSQIMELVFRAEKYVAGLKWWGQLWLLLSIVYNYYYYTWKWPKIDAIFNDEAENRKRNFLRQVKCNAHFIAR